MPSVFSAVSTCYMHSHWKSETAVWHAAGTDKGEDAPASYSGHSFVVFFLCLFPFVKNEEYSE